MLRRASPLLRNAGKQLRLVGRRTLAAATVQYEVLEPTTATRSNNDNGSGSIPIVFFHGLLGNRRNIRTMARAVCHAKQRTGIVVDLPGHGQSRDVPVPQGFGEAANRIQEALRDEFSASLSASSSGHVVVDVVGHSLGGRLALYIASQQQQQQTKDPAQLPPPHHHWKLRHVWLLDTVPGTVDASVAHVLQTARSVPSDMEASQLVAFFTARGLSRTVAEWLKAQYDTKQCRFAFHLDAADAYVRDFHNHDFWTQVDAALHHRSNDDDHQQCCRIHLVEATRNPAWSSSSSSRDEIQAHCATHPGTFTHHAVDAGHWVHVDNLTDLLKAFDAVEW